MMLRKALTLTALAVALTATPALADGNETYPPTDPPPPACVDCDTADTGFEESSSYALVAAIGLTALGLGATFVARKRTKP